MKPIYVLLLSLLLVSAYHVSAQTCCSGGVPLTNNIGGLPPGSKGTLQLSLNFDANYLRTLKDDAETLDDDSRQRTTYSLLLRSAYTITDRITVEAILSGVRQNRTINQNGFQDVTETNGLGDAVFMGHYTYLQKSTIEMAFGAGFKAPTGPSDLKNDRGLTLNADLQPGSGAWDGIFHHRISKSLPSRPSLSITNLITYRLTGVNRDYLGSQEYEFGDEFSIILGASERTAILKNLWGYGLNLRYRHAAQDINDDQLLPNTGGQWLFLAPMISWYAGSNTAINLNAEVPLFSRVTGTQLTPTYRINVGVYFSFSTVKEQIFNNK